MTRTLEELYETYPRNDQETKRAIGEFLYEQPAHWIPRHTIVEHFDIDESGVSRHINDLYEDEFIQSTKEDGERLIQWKGRGAGGVDYWLCQMIPSQMWAAGSELRPFLTLESLGGAYIPTVLFGVLSLVGIFAGLSVIVTSYLPSETLFGLTVVDLIFLTGAITVAASLLLILSIFGRLLEIAIYRVWYWLLERT